MANEQLKNVIEFVANYKQALKEAQEKEKAAQKKAKAYCIDLLKSIDSRSIFFTNEDGDIDETSPFFRSHAFSKISTDMAGIQSIFLDENGLVFANLEFLSDTAQGVCLDNENELDWVVLLNSILQRIG